MSAKLTGNAAILAPIEDLKCGEDITFSIKIIVVFGSVSKKTIISVLREK